ncbi:hypothetical protein [Candidatus Nanohalobium constans]|uniref:Uncharacterized protein n=1 Tax=Candidatus Nanohalobium constans TaxID=2565781 RepID=A0A5Q0UFD8_9ARCH|nr:hypothetical protein [Candidatus Nanohalobium constans]QGA80322.1 hypothetical protein LC1Nh_0421 [Candidatus Nanohalobium constans]
MKPKSTKILTTLFSLLILTGIATATDLQNIESITPLGSQNINVNGTLDLNNNNPILAPTKVDGVDLDNPAWGLYLNNNQYRIDTGDTDSRYLNRNGDAMTGDLNLKDNSIENAVISPFSWISDPVILGHYNNYFIGADEKWSVSSNTNCRSGSLEDLFDHQWNSGCDFNDADLPVKIKIDFNKANTYSFSNDFGKMMLYFEYGRHVSDVKVERYHAGGDDTCGDGNEYWDTIYQNSNFKGKKTIIDMKGDGQTCQLRTTLDGNSEYTDDIRFSSWNMYLHGDRGTQGGSLRKSGDNMYGPLDMSNNPIKNIDWSNSDQPPGSTDDQNLQDTSRNSGTVTIPIENGGSTSFTDKYEANTDAATRCGSDEVLEGGDNCVSNYEAADDGDTSSTNELQNLGQVLSRGSDANNANLNNINDVRWTDNSGNDIAGYVNSEKQLAFIQKSGTVTGVAIKAGDLDLEGNSINNIGGLQNCGADEFVNGNGNCVKDSDTSSSQNLQQTLSNGNSAGTNNIDLNGQSLTSSNGEICAGNRC